jgi:hypothetical protein
VTSPLELKSWFNMFRARPGVRRTAIVSMTVLTSVYLAVIAIVMFQATSNRARWILAAVLCLGAIEFLMLGRFWREIGKESEASTRASASNTHRSGP